MSYEKFPAGSIVRIADSEQLARFHSEWQFHHKLQSNQLLYAGAEAVVESVEFYHGGDVLYQLNNVPGAWHEQCLIGVRIVGEEPLTEEQVAEHDRLLRKAADLTKGELFLESHERPPPPTPATRQKLAQAFAALDRVRQLNKRNWSAMWLTAKIHQRLGNHSTALEWLSRACNIDGHVVDVEREASICAMMVGSAEEGIAYARKAAGAKPSDQGLRVNLALAILLSGQASAAQAEIRAAAEGGPLCGADRTAEEMIEYFVSTGQVPPATLPELESLWGRKKRRPRWFRWWGRA